MRSIHTPRRRSQTILELSDHLIYIDITQVCGIGCSFCMYADRHSGRQALRLDDAARDNLARLINGPGIKRVSISGEGEPLNNIRALQDILGLAGSAVRFEFITSGFLPKHKLVELYGDIERRLASSGSTCNIRLSSDSYHIEKIKHRPHACSVAHLLESKPPNLTLSFRSIDIDREFTREYLSQELRSIGLDPRIEAVSGLRDRLFVAGLVLDIDYKNLVDPTDDTPVGYLDLDAYIGEIERSVGKEFTLGSLNRAPMPNGMDITVKPNGDVHFYGAESILLGNIHSETLSLELLAARLRSEPFLRALHTIPLRDIFRKLSVDEAVGRLIKKTNNPYWVFKRLVNDHPHLLEQVASL
jgi:hypothetical protein